ncbi:MAG: hypothetical protein KF726_21680 [Anaerolineae bacterium]|nr:hypothetical protein [Anaerolineae bacterium]
MTTYEQLSLIISVASAVFVVISLLYLAQQTRLSAQQTKSVAHSLESSALNQILSTLLKLSETLLEYPEMRKYLYGGVDCPPDHPDYERLQVMLLLYLDTFDYYIRTSTLVSTTGPMSKSDWYPWIIDMFKTSPALRKQFAAYSERNKHWYLKELRDLYLQAERELALKQ